MHEDVSAGLKSQRSHTDFALSRFWFVITLETTWRRTKSTHTQARRLGLSGGGGEKRTNSPLSYKVASQARLFRAVAELNARESHEEEELLPELLQR